MERGFFGQQLVLSDDSMVADTQPTYANILTAVRWLVQGAVAGNALFLYYCGRAQRRDRSADATDLLPCDFEANGALPDAAVTDIVSTLPPGVKLTIVSDCYPNGQIAELPHKIIANQDGSFRVVEGRRLPCDGHIVQVSGKAIADTPGAAASAPQNLTQLFINLTGGYDFVVSSKPLPQYTHPHTATTHYPTVISCSSSATVLPHQAQAASHALRTTNPLTSRTHASTLLRPMYAPPPPPPFTPLHLPTTTDHRRRRPPPLCSQATHQRHRPRDGSGRRGEAGHSRGQPRPSRRLEGPCAGPADRGHTSTPSAHRTAGPRRHPSPRGRTPYTHRRRRVDSTA